MIDRERPVGLGPDELVRPPEVAVDADAGPARSWWRAAAALGTGIALVAALVATSPDPDPGPTGTLGRADLPPDLVADAPLPPAALAAAWERSFTDTRPGDRRAVVTADVLSADDGIVAIGGLMVDLDDHEVVGRRPFGVPAGDGRVLLGDGRVVETWDVELGQLVERRPITGIGPGASVSVRASLSDGAVLVQLHDAEGRARYARVDAAGVTTLVPLPSDRDVVTVVGGHLVATTDGVVVEWIDLATGAEIASFGPAKGAGALVDVGDHIVRAVGDELLAIDGGGGLSTRGVRSGAMGVGDLRVLGRAGDRLVVAGRAGSEDRWDVVHVALPPWSGDDGEDAVRITRARPPVPRAGDASFGPRAASGIARPGDATVVSDMVVLHDAPAGVIRGVDLVGTTRWAEPATSDAAVTPTSGHVLLTSPTATGRRLQLLSVADGRRRWTGLVPDPARPVELVAVHDGAFVVRGPDGRATQLDALSGRTRADEGDDPGRPLGVVPGPSGTGTALVSVRQGEGGATVLVGERRIELEDDDGVRSVQGIAAGTLVTRRTVDRGGASREQVELVHPHGGITVVAGGDGPSTVRWGRLPSVIAIRRDGDSVLLDPASGATGVRVEGAAGVDGAGEARLVALGHLDWWLVDRDDGAPVGDRWDLAVGQPVIGDGLVATVGLRGTTTVVGADDGAVRWVAANAPVAPSASVFAGGHLLVGSHDGRVVEFDRAGAPVRELRVGRGTVTGIAWVQGTLLVVVDGVLRGFRADGEAPPGDEVRLP